MNQNYLWKLYPLARKQLVNVKNNKATKLKGPECRVLEFLIENKGNVVSKQDIIFKVWGERVVTDASLTQSIAQLRLALGDNGKEQKFIKTVPYKGYLLFDNVVDLIETDFETNQAIDLKEPFKKSTQKINSRKLNSKKNNENIQCLKFFYVLLLSFFLIFQLLEMSNGLTFSWGEDFDKWKEEKKHNIKYIYQDTMSSKILHEHLSGVVSNIKGNAISELFISTGFNNYYVSCIYEDKNTKEQRVKNMTFYSDMDFYSIKLIVYDRCK